MLSHPCRQSPIGTRLAFGISVTDKRKIIVIPLFEDRVSPRCEYADRMLLLEMADRKEISRSFLNLAKLDPLQKMNFIVKQGINEVVCTGMSGFWRRMLEANHIRVIQTMSFDVNEVIDGIRNDSWSNRRAFAREGRR